MKKIYYINRLFPNNQFRTGDEQMIEKIVEEISRKKSVDIRHIAQVNYTSPASISRLAKRAGFNNFKELIFFLSNKFGEKPKNPLDNLSYVSCSQEMEVIDQYLNDFFAEKKVYLFGEGFCQFLVSYTYRKLLLKQIYAIDLEGVEINLVSDNTPHTLLTFSQSGENKNGRIKMEECRKLGGKVISFTASENSYYAQESDLAFIVNSGNVHADQENQGLNYFYGNSLNLIEYLVSKYS